MNPLYTRELIVGILKEAAAVGDMCESDTPVIDALIGMLSDILPAKHASLAAGVIRGDANFADFINQGIRGR